MYESNIFMCSKKVKVFFGNLIFEFFHLSFKKFITNRKYVNETCLHNLLYCTVLISNIYTLQSSIIFVLIPKLYDYFTHFYCIGFDCLFVKKKISIYKIIGFQRIYPERVEKSEAFQIHILKTCNENVQLFKRKCAKIASSNLSTTISLTHDKIVHLSSCVKINRKRQHK